MSWTPLHHRLQQLPLILAGPILRRTEPDAVTVWVALQEPCTVSLGIYTTNPPEQGKTIGKRLFGGYRTTVALGKFLHVVAVTARSIQGDRLQAGQIYAYDLLFERQHPTWRSATVDHHPTPSSVRNLREALNSAFSPQLPISYFDHQLPTFILPPPDINQLKILHGSCRKIHGGGKDTLPILDRLLEFSAGQLEERPHQLFLTGDQVYADDVADPMLWFFTEMGDTLLGWEESLPIGVPPPETTSSTAQQMTPPSVPHRVARELEPGQRSHIAEMAAGLTAGLGNQPERAKSHLFSFGEYCAIYLATWSTVLWPDRFPAGQDLHQHPEAIQQWDQAVKTVQEFAQTMGRVRRALANIPTYMIFDDHDVSDDWYLNQGWCNRVLGTPLGRRVVQHGLLAYAIFQGWGNTPEQFEAGQPGDRLLQAAQRWSASAGTDEAAVQAIQRYVGLPDYDRDTGTPEFRQDGSVCILDHDPASLKWHYTIRSNCHEVLVLDTRTWRGYPADLPDIAPPSLLSHTAFEEQIQDALRQSDRLQKGSSGVQVTLVVAPTNLITSDLIDVVQVWDLRQGKTYDNDVGDAWNINKAAFATLLKTLFEHRHRVIVLSGDIHYGYAARLNYWSHPPHSKTFEKSHVLVQLTSSALKNQEWKTELIHSKIKSLALENPDEWLGWHDPPDLREVQIVQGYVRTARLPVPDRGPVVKRLPKSGGNWDLFWKLAVEDQQSLPDWRYRAEWMRRQRSRPVPWGRPLAQRKQTTSKPQGWRDRLKQGLVKLWHNRWLQEGEEVVGFNNLGLVWFQWSDRPEVPPVVIQDSYWYAPWENEPIVFSRFQVPLALQDPPESLPVIVASSCITPRRATSTQSEQWVQHRTPN